MFYRDLFLGMNAGMLPIAVIVRRLSPRPSDFTFVSERCQRQMRAAKFLKISVIEALLISLMIAMYRELVNDTSPPAPFSFPLALILIDKQKPWPNVQRKLLSCRLP